MFQTIVGEDFVRIDCDGAEVLYWTRNEWVEDPDVVLAIVNAVRMSYEDPVEFSRKLALQLL